MSPSPVSVWQLLLCYHFPNELFHWARLPLPPLLPLKKNHILGVPFASAEIEEGTGGRGTVGIYQVNSCANHCIWGPYSISHNSYSDCGGCRDSEFRLHPDPLKQNLRDRGLDIGIFESAPGHSDLQAKFKLLPYIRLLLRKHVLETCRSHQYKYQFWGWKGTWSEAIGWVS